MLTHPTFEQLNQLGLFGMAKAFGETEASAEAAALTHPEWLALLLGRELAYRHDKKLGVRLRQTVRKRKLAHGLKNWTAKGDGFPSATD